MLQPSPAAVLRQCSVLTAIRPTLVRTSALTWQELQQRLALAQHQAMQGHAGGGDQAARMMHPDAQYAHQARHSAPLLEGCAPICGWNVCAADSCPSPALACICCVRVWTHCHSPCWQQTLMACTHCSHSCLTAPGWLQHQEMQYQQGDQQQQQQQQQQQHGGYAAGRHHEQAPLEGHGMDASGAPHTFAEARHFTGAAGGSRCGAACACPWWPERLLVVA